MGCNNTGRKWLIKWIKHENDAKYERFLSEIAGVKNELEIKAELNKSTHKFRKLNKRLRIWIQG